MESFWEIFFLILFNIFPTVAIFGISFPIFYLIFDIIFAIQILIFNAIIKIFNLKLKKQLLENSYFLELFNEKKDDILALIVSPFAAVVAFYSFKLIFVTIFNLVPARVALNKSIKLYGNIFSERAVGIFLNFLGFGFLFFLFGGLIVGFILEYTSKKNIDSK